jgi:hypothetical protein
MIFFAKMPNKRQKKARVIFGMMGSGNWIA